MAEMRSFDVVAAASTLRWAVGDPFTLESAVEFLYP
jgi:hypothetical protein